MLDVFNALTSIHKMTIVGITCSVIVIVYLMYRVTKKPKIPKTEGEKSPPILDEREGAKSEQFGEKISSPPEDLIPEKKSNSELLGVKIFIPTKRPTSSDYFSHAVEYETQPQAIIEGGVTRHRKVVPHRIRHPV